MFERAIQYLVKRAGINYTASYRAVATVLGALLFLAGWPALIYLFGRFFGAPVFPDSFAKFLTLLFFCLGIPWMGWAACFNQVGAYVCALILEILLICEIKFVEEKELEIRFGEAYRQYKKETPFFLPRIPKKFPV